MKRLRSERYTLLFLAGFALLVAGVAQISGPGAFVLAGLVLCVGAALLAMREERERERERERRRGNVDLG